MIAEIFTILANCTKGSGLKNAFKGININKRKIRSISSFSSNSIFYFNSVVVDQALPEEVGMISKVLEKSYASFVVACISLMPFHRVKADDRASIESYLSQFHQNIGISGPDSSAAKALGFAYSMSEAAYGEDEALKQTQDFLLECWEVAKRRDLNFIRVVSETVSLNDMFNLDPVDPITKTIQEQYHARLDELDSWGFIGEATATTLDEFFSGDDYDDDDYELDDDEDLDDEDEEFSDLDDEIARELGENATNEAYNAAAGAAKLELKQAKLKAKQAKFGVDQARYASKLAKEDIRDLKSVRKAAKADPGSYKSTKAAADKLSSERHSYYDFGNSSKQEKPKEKKKQNNQPQRTDNYRRVTLRPVSADATPDLEDYDENVLQQFGKACANSEFGKFGLKVGQALVKRKNCPNKHVSCDDEGKLLNDDDSLTEANVKNAVNSIMFSLESVSENKIMNCQSLTKLASMEAKLNKLKGKYAKYLNRYKRKYQENQKKGSNSKLKIRFNGEMISNPKEFMQQYGEYIKIINRRLKAVDKRREQLRKRKGLGPATPKEAPMGESAMMDLSELDFAIVQACDEAIQSYLDAPEEEIFDTEPADEFDKDEESLTEAKGPSGKQPNELRTAIDYNNRHPANDVNIARTISTTDGKKKVGLKSLGSVDSKPFTDMEMKKANEAIPTFAKATIGFIIDETEEVVNRDVLVGIKVLMHSAPAQDLINDIYNTVINKRKFLRFVKWYSGEERSLADLLFGFKELRVDALNSKSAAGKWTGAFRRRKRWANMSVPYLMKEYTPNGTVILTMNEVEFLKSEYGVDIMRPDHIQMIMENSFLLGFVVLDQANEIAYITYDGHQGSFQQYTYDMLTREQSQDQRFMKEMFRAMSR